MCSDVVAPEDLAARAATVDEMLSDEFESLPELTRDTDPAAKHLAAWCNSSAGGDWELFERRLKRDGYTIPDVQARFATARRRPSVPLPQWACDADWIQAAIQNCPAETSTSRAPFAHIFSGPVADADARLWDSVGAHLANRFALSARDDLRRLLITSLCELCAPVLYERFIQSSDHYDAFVAQMKSGGLLRLFNEKPVLLRLVASLTRQWLTTSREFVIRLNDDHKHIRHDILHRDADAHVAHIHGSLSDRHSGGRSVLCVEFDDGTHVMYKPRDLHLDVAWRSLVERLNEQAPIQLRAAEAIARDGYGWAEFIEHTGSNTQADCQRFFRRAGAWLALFHCFAASDMHHENLIAAGDHPVPVDVETLLQPTATRASTARPESQAYEAARELIANSVAAVGLLPSYGKSANGIRAAGGVASEWPVGKRLVWEHVNSDAMRPSTVEDIPKPSNLPRFGIDGYVGLTEHIEDFIAGFREYAAFVSAPREQLFDGFAGLPVRKVIRPTQFYSMLQQRLRDDRTMEDGVVWSSQADFLARLADWDSDTDDGWALQREERRALLDLNVPLFTTLSDDGPQRARDRVAHLDHEQIAWQVDVIRQTSPDLSGLRISDNASATPSDDVVALPSSAFLGEADTIAGQIAGYAIRAGSGAAWIGLGWFADSNATQLSVLGHDFYNGVCGVATFFAAHARITQSQDSADLALAAIAHMRAELRSRRASRIARVMGIGGATGLGSLVYGLTCISRLLDDGDLTAEALDAAGLFSDELIAADTQLDVIGGSAGAILSLLSLYRHTRAEEILDRAVACGTHLLAQPRLGPHGRRSWPCRSSNDQVLNGMSHGAAGFAYALTALATATGRDEFADAAAECLEFERSNFDAQRSDWCDFRVGEPHWRSQWCHGAVGIGLARLGMSTFGSDYPDAVHADIEHALTGAARGWPGHADTLCCGALGSVELTREAGKVQARDDLHELATKRLSAILQAKSAAGSYRWSVPVSSRFNVGLFRGLAGVGYTCLREVDDSLPNPLIWE
ncbi:type 2 lanthipeptide synthetase LanM family protein [Mycobacterium sp.]|uniref:type 2 lanthipeptide synthetase LanM family protein n=1 Tax=Mycobacterium sp. TaxID=1785 RepID=UPI002D19EEA0|nr:type 2 lanthipeptide synthetase LanM family protein [Mycobacterium sp.]HKP40676.1 type 2 lanthipeptide synthetase LanM family protein [Mycobacterium sp.]